MISYRDRTFCRSDCTNSACHRFVSDDVWADVKRSGLPLSMADFSWSCPEYQQPKKDATVD